MQQQRQVKNLAAVDAWNELLYPPDFPLSTNEPSYLLPHLLADEEWQQSWREKGLNVPS